ncbi:hypothetical protein [Ignavibacterium sp.]|uniref:hypothetical protein n=1 Tax=Ignavibacterium sp. TaxID=2651167 RepID=UPI00307DD859
MKRKKFYFYKCSVGDCLNKVYSPGAICPACIDKLIKLDVRIVFCDKCGNIINLQILSPDESSEEIKLMSSLCSRCDPLELDRLF